MAGKQVNFDVNVDSSDAVKGLRDFSRAAQRTEDAAKGLDDAATSGDRARIAIKAMADAMDTELRGATAAAALGAALGPELAGRMDVDQVTANLNKMGVSFDEIRAEANQFATTLKQVDDIRLNQTTAGLDNMKSKLDGVRNSSDQSRSVLANMAGNTAQDLGELGGVVGSVGVGIGQLAEYAVDGNISLANLGKIAGPLAGLTALSLGVKTVQERLSGIAESQKAYDDALDKLKTSFIETGDAAEVLDEQIHDNVLIEAPKTATTIDKLLDDLPVLGGKLEEQTHLWEDVADPTLSMVAALDAAGLEFEDVQQAADGGGNGMRALRTELLHLKDAGIITEETFQFLDEQLGAYQETLFGAAAQTEISGRVFTRSLDGINEGLREQEQLALAADQNWRILLDDMADGALDTQAAADAYNILQTNLGLTNEEMDELVQEKLGDKLGEDAERADELNAALLEGQDVMRESADVLDEYADSLDNVALRGDAFAEAMDDVNRASGFDLSQRIISFKEELDGLGEALDAARDAGVDFASTDVTPDTWDEVLAMPEELGAVVEAFAGMREQIQTEMGRAFAEGGAPEARRWAEKTRQAVVDEIHALGLDAETEAALVAQAFADLGIADQDVEIAIRLSNQEQARSVLDGLQGAIDNLPEEIQLRVAATAAADPIAAVRQAVEAFAAQGIEIPVELTTLLDTFESDVKTARDKAEGEPAVVPVEANPKAFETTTNQTVDKPRTANIGLAVLQILVTELLLNAVARPRTATITADVVGENEAERILHQLERDRFADIFVRTHNTGGGGGGGGAAPGVGTLAAPLAAPMAFGAEEDGAGVATLAAPMVSSVPASGVAVVTSAPAPVTNNFTVKVQAAVIGNPAEVDRAVSKALRRHVRLNGSRN